MSELEETLLLLIRDAGLPEPVREYRFCERRFRFDFAWVEQKLAVEVQGGTWTKGGHSTGSGLDRDYEKLNIAQTEGWRVLQFSRRMIEDGTAVEMIKKAIGE